MKERHLIPIPAHTTRLQESILDENKEIFLGGCIVMHPFFITTESQKIGTLKPAPVPDNGTPKISTIFGLFPLSGNGFFQISRR